MNAIFVIIFMIVVGAIIGGITNVIAIRMLFHPFKPLYIFHLRVPFTPGLIPKRRREIASKIGQVIEEHLLTESLIKAKLESKQSQQAIEDILMQQISKVKHDNTTIASIAQHLNIDIDHVINDNVNHYIQRQIMTFYNNHQAEQLVNLIPETIQTAIDNKVEEATDLLCDRARKYLSSERGTKDINDMIDTFFNEKGKIIGMLQMFMTKESIADRIQQELIRLTSHPKAKAIATTVIHNEYLELKRKQLNEVITEKQFAEISEVSANYISNTIYQQSHRSLQQMMPNVIDYLEQHLVQQLTTMITSQLSKHLSSIMKKVNLRGLVEEQINTFDLDYIEKLIIEIADKELKLIMSLGFILGGIIGFFQGLVAIFV
ncbi:DUF445 domain-containing protein [Staphylococcus simiae]|uniref:DUF445 domain-containing protein n=1 Tax=Staphylococcus simiae TaxID=308354 RepID=UPI001A970315|nr:DUF445 family protein [Staphylococcus simiae]MBO1199189.1 DUF445 domain-containing protein [Staphylococcus simiae]MBO1201408.1 DUF445 domain-containing protein [Staphylococcus simiae]MBO1203538.1 DUF445 domain-containing protein [Staphylococcus simiae]MBO1211161.1 DUF445 domain-containing protein [Staphylococcus simiae]MBO1229728.1 DUF445 domain-containing protein [Staphylococcus simiae]